MKKLFSIFFVLALLLMASMVTNAQVADYTWSYVDGQSTPTNYFNTNGYEYVGQGGSGSSKCNVYQYQWNNKNNGSLAIKLVIAWKTSSTSGTWTNPNDGNDYVMPPVGSYSFSSSRGDKKIANYNATSTWAGSKARYSVLVLPSGTQTFIYDITSSSSASNGKLTFAEGADGPYITTTGVNSGYGARVYTTSGAGPYGYYTFTIGSPATYATISTVSDNNTMGTASISYVSGYVYTKTKEYKNGSTYRLTASANTGYNFVCWKKNGTQISTNPTTDVIIDGNATYTAYFESQGATQYTISTAVSPAGYGTVSGGGTYYENTGITLTATSANEHLYFFDHWLKDGVTYAGGATITPTVTADATYTAVFRNANAGTITGVAANGTIAGTGYYAGGTAVELTVTPNDGYIFTQWSDGNTDNPRTVYVDGNATYTAQFVQGVAINVEMGRLGVYDSSDAATMNDGSSGNAWFHIIGKDGDYEVRFESYGKYFSSGKVYGSSDVDQNWSWIKRNGVNVPLNFNDISATATLNRTYGGKYGIYDISIRMVGTDGTVYLTTGQCVRAIYYDTADDYAFPKMDYNFSAPSFMSSIPEDYGPNSYTYTADGDGKWLYLKQSINSVDYYLRLCFKVAGNSIPTGTYHLNATGSGIPAGTAIPTILYNTSTTGGYWPNEVNGSNVFVWEQAGDENAYWWFLEYGTINVVNTNGVYYVEVDAINSFAEPVRFTMGTPPVVSYNLAWDANGGELSGTYTAAGSVNEGATITAPTATRTGYTFNGWSPAFTGTMPSANTTYTAQWTPSTYTVTVAKNNNTYGTLTDESDNVRVINNVPYGATFTVEGNQITINGTTVTATPADATARYTYSFNNWTNALATVTGDMTVTATFTRTVNTYDITWKSEDGTSTLETDAAQAFGTTTAYNGAVPTKSATGYTYTFDGWATEANGAKAYNNGETPAVSGAATYYAHFTGGANTYTVTFAANGGSGTMADQAFTYGTAQNLRANTFTGPSATITYDFNGATGGNSKASETVNATFSGWLDNNSNTYTDEQEVNNLTATNGATVTMTAQWEMLAEVTLPQPTKTGYTLYAWEGEVEGMNMSIGETDDWSFFVTTIEPVTMTAQWNIVPYTITYEGLEGATNTNPTSYNVETETITLADPGTRDGYIFAGWKDESDNTITQITQGSTGNRTLTATWNAKSSDITLCENCDNNHYNTFKTNYNGETVNVTYNRQFAEGRWSTMCLPFSLNLATMTTNQMYGCVYEFKYATGNANVGSGVNLYFSNAKSIEAGKCYIVNANAELADKTSFVFIGVTIDLSKDNGAALDSKDDYDDLWGYNSQGTIELVGTLRNGTLKGVSKDSQEGNTYMGLKSNKIYYPNTDTGSTIWAYRGIFRSSEFLDKESMQKMRIVVDGEDRGELIIDADGDILAPSDAQSRKFIENGVLYIEREGVIYDAQGKRIK